jgi:nitroreductase
MDVRDAITRRRMVRAYVPEPVDPDALDRVLDAARRAPTAGLSDALDLLVLTEASDRARFWDLAFPVRDDYGWPHLFDAPVVIVPFVEPDAYARRYAQPDKAVAGLADLDAWPAPYWWIDGGAAVENVLLAATGEGLGSSLFGLFVNEDEIRRAFGVPDGRRALGGITIGHARSEPRVVSSPTPRRALRDMVHRGRW